MFNRFKYTIILCVLAALMCLEIFVLKNFNFWIEMMIGTVLLASAGLYVNHKAGQEINYRIYYFEPMYILIGIFSAALLYGMFFFGDIISKMVFSFADKQILSIYENKSLLSPATIVIILTFFIGPAEEVFWRGFVQDTFQQKFGDNKGWIIASLVYGVIHLVSLNLILSLAAVICGFFWGYIYKRYRSIWPGIISHAIWDATIFVLIPLR